MLDVISTTDARRWAAVTRALFAVHREHLDRLNVYPVPDGDTGTNLYLTFDGAIDTLERDQSAAGRLGRATLAEELTGLTRALLLSARGNSGVILSQLVRGFADAATEHEVDALDARLVGAALRAAADRARNAVAHPVEGTVLTVARDVADAAAAHLDEVGPDADLPGLCEVMLAAAATSLADTPHHLPALAHAGVVDAGGAGYLLLVDALNRVVRGEHDSGRIEDPRSPANERAREAWGGNTSPRPVLDPGATLHDGTPGGPAYEVMYLLEETDDERVATLTSALDALGDSLLVVGGPDLWNVHVHVDDPGAAVEAGIEAGRPSRIRITHFGAQIAEQTELSDVGVVACAAGPGIARLLAGAGATVVTSGPGRRASTGQLLDAIRAAHARSVILLPNDNDTVMAARAAAQAGREEGVTVHVVSARTVVQGLAALAVFDPDRPADENALTMAEAAVAMRHGGVTVAAREGLTSAGVCQVGDVLGVVGGDFSVIGHDLVEVALAVLRSLLAHGGELVTLVTGSDAPDDLADRVVAAIEAEVKGLDVQVIDGGQPHYPLLVGVE